MLSFKTVQTKKYNIFFKNVAFRDIKLRRNNIFKTVRSTSFIHAVVYHIFYGYKNNDFIFCQDEKKSGPTRQILKYLSIPVDV